MDIIAIAILTFFASMIGTMTGFGTSTIMIPILVFFFPPIQAIYFVSIIHWFGNVWKLSLFKKGFDITLFLTFGVTGLVASYFGARISLNVADDILKTFLGIFFLLYALFFFVEKRLKMTPRIMPAIVGGTLSGFSAGLFGMGGAIRSAFLLLYGLPKAVHIATLGAIGLVVDSTRLLTYFFGNAELPTRLLFALIVCIPLSFIGARIAKELLRFIPQYYFRTFVACILFLLGIFLIVYY